MSLFETEVAKLSSSFISSINMLEANRTCADMTDQLGNMLREAGIANHADILVHQHYTPTKLDFRIIVYQRANGIKRVFELLGAVTAAKGGHLSVCDQNHYKQNSLFLQLPELHVISIDFEDKEITREALTFLLDEVLS